MSLPDSAMLAQLAAGPASAAELTGALEISQPALSRAMQALQRADRVIRIGAARSTRYGLRREIPGAGSNWPVFQVDERGAILELGRLQSLEPRHYFFDSENAHLRGLTAHIPYVLQDQRPGGFLGRMIPSAWPELALPPRVVDWTDDHYLAYLTQRGTDTVSDLIVGAEALERYLGSLRTRPAIRVADRESAYPALAAAAMAGIAPGSSVHGEHPKFTTLLDHGAARTHVIVKFSPPRSTRVGQRWADLLLAEHIAHQHLAAHGMSACRSTVFEFGDRSFLEVERFDRAGEEGRRGVVSLLALDGARYGRLDRWPNCAVRLRADRLISMEDVDRIRLLEAFGQLIANTDRHFGNLGLFDRYDGQFELAPAYDMLPMLFAPMNDQIIERSFEAPEPTAETLSVWPRAKELAESYWATISTADRISSEFRAEAHRVLAAVRAAPQRAAMGARPA
jgi:DNA-binding transcriptional ArsR family regulator